MRPIQMVDTVSQYQKIKAEVDAAVMDVMASGAYIGGKPVGIFAENLAKYTASKYVIPCANGTDALQIALMAIGARPGDEIICPSFTFIATTEVVALLGLTPVFVDVDEKSFCINPEEVKKAITSKTKAIIPVHLYGHAAPMEALLLIAQEYGLYLIEDNAQGLGCNYLFSDGKEQKTGTIGHIGTTSFYPSKNLGAFGDGGAIFTQDEALAEKIKMIANHGQKQRYYHEMIGCNSRLDTLQAAVLGVKLEHLDQYIVARQSVADFYDQAFKPFSQLTVPFRAGYNQHVFHQYTLLLDGVNRGDLAAHLQAHKVPNMIYYPVPCHKQKMFEAFLNADVELPVTDWLTQRVISLPIHTEMDAEQLEFIAQKVLEFIK